MGHVGPRFITGGEMSTQGGGHCLRVNWAWDKGLQKQVGPQGLSGLRGLTKVSVSKEAWGGRKCHPGLNPAPSKACYCVWWERDRCTTGPATWLKCQQSCGSSCIQPTLLRDHCGQWKGREDFPRARGWGKSHPSCWWEGSRCADLSERRFAWNNGLGSESCAGGRIAAVPSGAYSLGSRWLCIQLHGGSATLLPLSTNPSTPASHGRAFFNRRKTKNRSCDWTWSCRCFEGPQRACADTCIGNSHVPFFIMKTDFLSPCFQQSSSRKHNLLLRIWS